MKKIAITGTIASGKTTFCLLLRELTKAYIVSADELAHRFLSLKTPLGQKIASLLGPDVVEKGQIDREKVAKKVFQDPKKLKELETLIHPPIFHEIETLYQKTLKEGFYDFFVVEIALLFETGKEKFYDITIALVADEKIRKRRIKRKGLDEEEYERRKRQQLSQEEKAKKANFVIENNGSIEMLKEKIKALIPLLT